MSMETDETSETSGGFVTDPPADPAELGAMTEEEQIAYAMRMSMQEGEIERRDTGLNISSLFSGEVCTIAWNNYKKDEFERDMREAEKEIEKLKEGGPLSEAGPSKKEEGEAMDVDESKKEDYSEAMNDPAFLQVSSNDSNHINSSRSCIRISKDLTI